MNFLPVIAKGAEIFIIKYCFTKWQLYYWRVMKTTTLLLTLVAGAAFAGEPVSAPATSAPATTLGEWFVGGTYTDFEGNADMYALQIGLDLGTQFLGFDTAVYLEAGMYEDSTADVLIPGTIGGSPPTLIPGQDLEVNPFTVNLKLERPLVGPLNLYMSGGVGFATWDLTGVVEDDGASFYAQASAGVLYNLCERLELFAGGRLAYLEEISNEEIGWEFGGRINF